jgi:type IV pilus assembly protein PilW
VSRRPDVGRKAAAGFSLVEMMIALVLGTLLMMGLVQVFGASRAAYATSEGMARTQENGRFAMEFLQQDLRMGGHFGCAGDQNRLHDGIDKFTLTYANSRNLVGYNAEPWPLRFHISVQGYEATGSAPGGARTLLATPVVAGPAGGGGWSPALPNDLSAQAVPGSDVIVLRYVMPENVPALTVSQTAAPTITFDGARWPILAAGVTNPGLFALVDCAGATIFAGGRSGNSVVATIGAGDIGFQTLYTNGQAELHRAESVAYFVGIGASGEPALMRCRTTTSASTCPAANTEELVEGVENLQFIYGMNLVSAATGKPTGYVQTVRTAAQLGDPVASAASQTNWRMVGAVQVGMVVRSPGRANAETRALPFSILGLAVTPPVDQRTRAAYENTIAIRNRLFGN